MGAGESLMADGPTHDVAGLMDAGPAEGGGAVAERRELFCLPRSESSTTWLVAHPFLPLLFAGFADATLRVWDTESRCTLKDFPGHREGVYGLALDPAGRRLASGSRDSTIRLWDLDSGACLHTLAGHSSAAPAVAWDAAGLLVASGSLDKTVRIWDADSGALLRTLEGHSLFVEALAAHPADDLLASGSHDTTVRVWRWSSGECVHTLAGHTENVTSLAASASWLVSGSWDKTVRVWSWTSGECVRVIDGLASRLHFNALAWRESVLVTLEADGGQARVWDTSSEDVQEWSCVETLRTDSSSRQGVAVLSDGRVASVAPGDTKRIAVWGVK